MKKIGILCAGLMIFSLQANMSPVGFEQFPLTPVFFETGTWVGEGIRLALRAGYPKVYSLEINPNYVSMALNRFRHYPNVTIYLGDSGKDLWKYIQGINQQITFWLDGHRGVVDDKGGKNTPLLQELEQIKNHPIKNHIIIIDDMHCCEGPLFDYITKQDIIEKIKAINPQYIISYVDGGGQGEYPDNIMVAYVSQ